MPPQPLARASCNHGALAPSLRPTGALLVQLAVAVWLPVPAVQLAAVHVKFSAQAPTHLLKLLAKPWLARIFDHVRVTFATSHAAALQPKHCHCAVTCSHRGDSPWHSLIMLVTADRVHLIAALAWVTRARVALALVQVHVRVVTERFSCTVRCPAHFLSSACAITLRLVILCLCLKDTSLTAQGAMSLFCTESVLDWRCALRWNMVYFTTTYTHPPPHRRMGRESGAPTAGHRGVSIKGSHAHPTRLPDPVRRRL
jgi:hypothetical protein